MSLERLQLDPFLLAQMYHQPIIPEEITAVPAEAKAVPEIKYLGENQKNILLLIQNEREAYLSEETFNLLANILNACKLGMQDVALVNTANYPGIRLQDYLQKIPARQVINFAIEPASLGLPPTQPYQTTAFNGLPVLYSDDLQLIATDKALKGRLWMGLKQLFGI
ncbi:hypothetical protein [Chitinophaga sp.]|uniref:hypothetical protein n=1 Tax=Chitinophaga sp. TaxID=1869181 RepID=UPI0026063491|nr:hypothetical protein [uncultured Chitinophaga sp.]